MAAFGLPNFGQITEAFKKAQQIQQDAQKLQEELEALELKENDIAIITGSLYLAGEVLNLN